MPDTPEQEFPITQRDHVPGTVITEWTLYVLQTQREDGRWMEFLTPREDRDEMTRIQTHRLLDADHKGERRRVLRRVTQIIVDEVEGDGEGETSAEMLIARNTENTERLIKKDQQPAT